MKLEDDYKVDRGNGSGTQTGYSVEARSKTGPTLVRGQLFGKDWSKVQFDERKAGRGIPAPGGYDSSGQLLNRGLLSYPSAQALRWWFHADAENDEYEGVRIGGARIGFSASPIGIETRLVKHEIKYNYTITAVSAHDEVKDVFFGPPKEAEPT